MSATENNKVKAAKLRKRNTGEKESTGTKEGKERKRKGLTEEEKPDGTVGR